MTGRAAMGVWVVKELAGASALIIAGWAYTHDLIATAGVLVAAVVSAAGGIAAARTARDNRDHRELTESELSELRAMLERRRGDRRGGPAGTPAGQAPISDTGEA